MPEVDEPRGKHLVQQAEQQVDVRAGLDRQVLVGDVRRLGASRIDHDEPAAARTQGLDAPLETGRAHQGSAGGDRVPADADEQLRPVDVGHGHQELVPEHHAGSHHVRELVHAGGRVEILRANGADEVADREHRAEVVHRRVADVERHGIVAVACAHFTDASLDLLERRGPGNLFPSRRRASHRPAQPVRVLVEVLQRDGFRADVAAAQHVVAVGLDREDLSVPMLDHDAAHGLADRAGAVMQPCLSHRPLPASVERHLLRRARASPSVPISSSSAGVVVPPPLLLFFWPHPVSPTTVAPVELYW